MKRYTVMLAALVGLFVLTNSAEASVLRVVVVETNDVAAYMGQLNTTSQVGEPAAPRQQVNGSGLARALCGPERGLQSFVAVSSMPTATFAAEGARSPRTRNTFLSYFFRRRSRA